MSEFLLYYKRPDPTTWVYMSSFLTIGLFFVFHRFWSVRNLDIALLILLAPGLLMVHEGRRRELRELESDSIASQENGYEREQEFNRNGWPDQQARNVDTEDFPKAAVLISAQQSRKDSESEAATSRDEKTEENVPTEKSPPVAGPNAPIAGPNAPIAGPARPKLPPSIQEETNTPLAVEPDALDKSQQEDALQGEDAESPESYTARQLQRTGFIFLFAIEFLILFRLMIDPMMTRRPLLDPNLTTGGLYFISISLFVFMMGNIVTSTPRVRIWQGPELGPGYALMHQLPSISTRPESNAVGGAAPATEEELKLDEQGWTLLAKILAILAHLAIVTGIILIGNRHFDNLRAGVGCATLYLMLPYTAQMTGRVDHALPAALLLWAVLNYRKPIVTGIFFGLAAGLVYYPLFLLPLWCSFYWRRGVRRFVLAVLSMLVVLSVLLTLGGTDTMADHLINMYGLFWPTKAPQGIWQLGWEPFYRLPVIVAFGILSFFFASWPSPKNLGTLISGSAALMVAAQFWHGHGGGLYIAWFLPLLLLSIFRPNLEDRVATKVVIGGRRAVAQPEAKAA